MAKEKVEEKKVEKIEKEVEKSDNTINKGTLKIKVE